jgi:hypothetical protein
MAQTMKALVKREAGKGIWMEDVPVPAPGPNEVLIKLEKTAICGTDLHIYLWDEWSQRTIKPGLVIGHEFVGRIAELGAGVTGYKVGQRVSAEGHIVCGHCRNFFADEPDHAVRDYRRIVNTTADAQPGHVLTGDYGFHAGHVQSLADIDPFNSSVRNRTAQTLSPQTVRQRHISAIERLPGNLELAFDPRRRLSHHLRHLISS